MERSMDEYIHRMNVDKYTRLLGTASDDARRALLMKLLAEEAARAKAAGWLRLYS